jgi:hypothetical protein
MARSTTDPVLAHSRATATKLMSLTMRYPANQRVPKVLGALSTLDPSLPTTVTKVASSLRSRGVAPGPAFHEAIARSFADSSIRKIQAMGRAAMRGQPVSMPGTSGLGGGLGDATADAVAKAFQGLICSTSLSNSVSDLVGKTQGADAHTATATGIAAAQGIAQCATLTPTTSTTPASTTTTDTTTTAPANPLVTYGLSFAVLAGVVAVGYFAIKKRPKVATA